MSNLIAALALVVSTVNTIWLMRADRRADRKAEAAAARAWDRTKTALNAMGTLPSGWE